MNTQDRTTPPTGSEATYRGPEQNGNHINRLDGSPSSADNTDVAERSAALNGTHLSSPMAAPVATTARRFNDTDADELSKLAAMAEGDQTGQLTASVSASQKASEHGQRKAAESTQLAVAAEKADTTAKLTDVRTEKKRTEKKRKVPGKRRRMGFFAVLTLVISTLALATFIYIENYGVGLSLTDIGAFAVDSVGKGMLLSATAVTVGLALAKGYSSLPPHWRRRAFGFACIMLVVLFGVYLFGFTIGAKDSGAQSSAGFGLASSSGGGTAAPQNGGLGAWLMLFGVLGMMPLTGFIASVSLKAFLDSFDAMEPEPDYVRLETQENLFLGALASLDTKERELSVALSQMEDEEQRKVQLSMQRYLAWKAHFAGRCPAPAPMMACAMALMLLTGCGDGGAKSAMQRMNGDADAVKSNAPVTRVLAASPRLDDAMRQEVGVLIEREAEFVSTSAPVGSSRRSLSRS
jgi:hypothetical protein